MKKRVIFVHGNQTIHWSFGFAPWLKNELEKSGFETFFETFPDSIIARSTYWLPFLKKYVKAGENDILVGWSSGAVAALRYAESNKINGSVLISPCYTDLDDALEKQSGYYNEPWDWESIKRNQQQIGLFYGDNDPYIPQEQFTYIASQLHSSVFKIHDGGHFILQKDFPQVLTYIQETYKTRK